MIQALYHVLQISVALGWYLRSNLARRECHITYITFLVFRTQQGSQQTITGRILRMSTLNDTIHSMLF